jgi:hypothetical protein
MSAKTLLERSIKLHDEMRKAEEVDRKAFVDKETQELARFYTMRHEGSNGRRSL